MSKMICGVTELAGDPGLLCDGPGLLCPLTAKRVLIGRGGYVLHLLTGLS
jgi:hypothetical protein